MRKLTKEEISNAPKWANSIFLNSVGSINWFDNINGYAQDFLQSGAIVLLKKEHFSFGKSQPIVRVDSMNINKELEKKVNVGVSISMQLKEINEQRQLTKIQLKKRKDDLLFSRELNEINKVAF